MEVFSVLDSDIPVKWCSSFKSLDLVSISIIPRLDVKSSHVLDIVFPILFSHLADLFSCALQNCHFHARE